MPKEPIKPGSNCTHFTKERRRRYIDVLQETGEAVAARREVGIHAHTVRTWRVKDETFRYDEEEALRIYRAGLAQEVHRRGVQGIVRNIYYNGVVVGQEVQYSDRLLLAQIRRHSPEYREKVEVDQRTELSGDVGVAHVGGLSRESQEDLRRVLQREADRAAKEGGE